jgi:hypothetical protein
MRWGAHLSVAIALLIATACSGEDAGASAAATGSHDAHDGSALPEQSTAASQGDVAGAIDLPTDLPVDLPGGGQVQGVFEPVEGTMQDSWVVRVLYPADTSDSLVAFYDQWFADAGLDVQATRNDRVARWVNRSAESPLMWVTVNFEDAFFDGNNRLEVWYDEPEG